MAAARVRKWAVSQPIGLYVSVPFCRGKCTFCNFASDAFPPERMAAYVDRVVEDVAAAHAWAKASGVALPRVADTVFLGGGTPSLLSTGQMSRLFAGIRQHFQLTADAEITVEAAPGQLSDSLLEVLLGCGVTRISLGVQSFVDAESRAVGRTHTGAQCHAEIERLRRAGVPRLSVDLIAGLPLQTEASWQTSLDELIACRVEHASVYMLEVDGDSRLGNAVVQSRAESEVSQGPQQDAVQGSRALSQLAVLGQHARYQAHTVPDDDGCAQLYAAACTALETAGLPQYEVSNFGVPSRHNLKYWQRAPYLGVGLDAHSMLYDSDGAAVRFAQTDDLDTYLVNTATPALEPVSPAEAFEEAVYLGLRLVEGISLHRLRLDHGSTPVDKLLSRAQNLAAAEVLCLRGENLRLTPHGRAISSTVFGQLLA